MTNLQIDQSLLELNERLLLITRSQAKLTWALRSIRTTRAHATTAVNGASAAARVPMASAPIVPTQRMLRVAPPLAVHRPTRRNYDYFDDLQKALNALPEDGPAPPAVGGVSTNGSNITNGTSQPL